MPLDTDNINQWDKIALAVIQSPSMVGIFASLGYVGHLLISGEPMTKRRVIGGILLSMFTGTSCYLLCIALNFPEKLALPLAFILGSMCETGYVLLTQRAFKLMGKE